MLKRNNMKNDTEIVPLQTKPSISVLLLSYKEADNLKILLPKIHKMLLQLNVDFEILVIDSEQTLDNTQEICRQYGALYFPQEWSCYGGAFRTGIKYAKYSCVLLLDADGSHDPSSIPDLYKRFLSGCDVVIGSRYAKGGVSNDSRISWLMSKLLNAVMRFALGLTAKDISTSFRIYDARQLKAVRLTRDNYDVLQEVLVRMKISNPCLRIAEVPITFEKRLLGKSKRKLFRFIAGYMKTLVFLTALRFRSCG